MATHYRVWKSGKPESSGETIAASSSFEARKICAAVWTVPVTEVLARKIGDPTAYASSETAYGRTVAYPFAIKVF